VGADNRSGIPHLTPALSAPGGGEGGHAAGLCEAEYDALLRADFAAFAQRAFHTLYPQSQFQMNWHAAVIAARLAAVRAGGLRRLLINLPPRHLKSLLASVAFPAWLLGHQPAAEIVCVSYAQDLADKWSRDCSRIVSSPWYRWLFPTRLAGAPQATAEFATTARGCRIATSTGGVLTGRGADLSRFGRGRRRPAASAAEDDPAFRSRQARAACRRT
jgi:hypothetical protein